MTGSDTCPHTAASLDGTLVGLRRIVRLDGEGQVEESWQAKHGDGRGSCATGSPALALALRQRWPALDALMVELSGWTGRTVVSLARRLQAGSGLDLIALAPSVEMEVAWQAQDCRSPLRSIRLCFIAQGLVGPGTPSGALWSLTAGETDLAMVWHFADRDPATPAGAVRALLTDDAMRQEMDGLRSWAWRQS